MFWIAQIALKILKKPKNQKRYYNSNNINKNIKIFKIWKLKSKK